MIKRAINSPDIFEHRRLEWRTRLVTGKIMQLFNQAIDTALILRQEKEAVAFLKKKM